MKVKDPCKTCLVKPCCNNLCRNKIDYDMYEDERKVRLSHVSDDALECSFALGICLAPFVLGYLRSLFI